ncbi:hypothetical protein C0J52_03507, partial [Blattella germanica]
NFATVTAGCSLGWTSPALPKINLGSPDNERWLYLETEESSWVGSLVAAGAILGPFLVAYMADKIGRKWTLLSTAIPALIGWIMIVFVETFGPLCAARFILGVGVGMVFAITPMYVGEIAEAIVEEMQRNKSKMSDLVSTKSNFKALYLCLVLVAGQQLAGINAVLFYSQDIFQQSGGSLEGAEATIVIGVVMFLASGVVLGVYFYLKSDNQDVSDIAILPILSLVFYISVYSIGYGPLPWAVLGELFPANVKSNASACTASFCWLIGFFVTRFYSDMADGLGTHWTFWIFAAITAASGAFIAIMLPETKGKSLQEIQAILSK